MEYFDVLDCTGEKTGEVVPRGEAHRTGRWHGAFHCLIIYTRNDRGVALFQKRSPDKAIAPGRYDVSVGGHYAAGEDAGIAGPREIREELGIESSFSDLFPLGRRIFVYCFTPGVTEYEFQDVFLLPRVLQPSRLVLQRDEVDGVIELDVERGIDLFSGTIPSVETSLFGTGRDPERVSIAPEDFVPCLDNYYLKMLLLARRFLRGDREPLLI